MRVSLFDYGAGNLHSLAKALEAGGAGVAITDDWGEALSQDALILPGVGSFGAAVRSLGENRDRIRTALEAGYPCLGICLGMQLFFERSEEGDGEGIGLIRGTVRRLQTRVVPQMGWNDVALAPDPVFTGLDGLVAYYANSFICEPRDPDLVIATTRYETETFAAGVRTEQTCGVQFHP
ncbi:MAG: imidazole glycerol phosphate synthase subunit HisH, partial [Gemmatimonadetes bacterium]|nr:imidazole glycerol phosphate synthase subunit HisH [Gemmatimonadota bacterium]